MRTIALISMLTLSALAQAELQALEDGELGSVNAQAGMTLGQTFKITLDELRYTDNDAPATPLAFKNVVLTSDGSPGGGNVSYALDIDVIAGSASLPDALQLRTNSLTFGMGVGSVTVGSGGSMGGLVLNGLSLTNSIVNVWGHGGKNYIADSSLGSFGTVYASAVAGKTLQGSGSSGVALATQTRLTINELKYVDDADANLHTSNNVVKLQGISVAGSNVAHDYSATFKTLTLVDVVGNNLQLTSAMEKADMKVDAIKIGGSANSVGKFEAVGLQLINNTLQVSAH